jgi:hypothetical protein
MDFLTRLIAMIIKRERRLWRKCSSYKSKVIKKNYCITMKPLNSVNFKFLSRKRMKMKVWNWWIILGLILKVWIRFLNIILVHLKHPSYLITKTILSRKIKLNLKKCKKLILILKVKKLFKINKTIKIISAKVFQTC